MIGNVELPHWMPAETPELAPPARTARWVSRIGAPAAIFLGRIRSRLVGAAVSFLFIPVGAVRLVLLGQSSPTATDPWGPADAFVIIAAILGLISMVSCIRAARKQRANAAHSAWVILRQGNPDVTQVEIAPTLVGTREFDSWASSRRIQPWESNASAVTASREGSKLLYARSVQGRYSLWLPRFGARLARDFLFTRIEAWAGAVLVVGSVLADGAGLVASFIESREDPASAQDFLPAMQLPLLVAFVIGWALVVFARSGPRGRYAILDAVHATLAPRDPKLTRNSVSAMFTRPVMYDMWVLKYSSPS